MPVVVATAAHAETPTKEDTFTLGTVKSKDFSGSRECAKPHKIVEFELPADKELVLQFSGSADSSVTASVTAVAASSPN